VALSRVLSVCSSVTLPLHQKAQEFSSGTGSPGWSLKKSRKTVVVWWQWYVLVTTVKLELFMQFPNSFCHNSNLFFKMQSRRLLRFNDES